LHTFINAQAADLVVMAAHGLSSKVNKPFGRTVVNFLAYGTVPLLVVQDLRAHEVELSAAEQAAKEHQGH
jgi:nucleotide-binding universal stress UspA family protein